MEFDQAAYIELYNKERKKVDLILNRAFSKRKPRSLYEPSEYIIKGKGKRIRPLLVLLSAKLVGGNFDDAYNAAAAVELLHNFTLVHDDIMDNADKRRGRLTVHTKYDESTAILAGDSLLSIAYEYLLKDCDGNSKLILDSFTKGLIEVCEGQSLDKEYESKKRVSLDEYLVMIKKKTASMIKMCCEVGAILGEGNNKEINGLAAYGLNLGIAFQIQDDLLDIIAEEKKFGKKIGGDLVEGKKTYLFIKALEKSSGKDRNSLNNIIQNKGIRINQVEKYKALYQKLDVIEDAKKAINYYTERALKSLSVIGEGKDRNILIWLADSLVKRNK